MYGIFMIGQYLAEMQLFENMIIYNLMVQQ